LGSEGNIYPPDIAEKERPSAAMGCWDLLFTLLPLCVQYFSNISKHNTGPFSPQKKLNRKLIFRETNISGFPLLGTF
jgi:hypothetical protein